MGSWPTLTSATSQLASNVKSHIYYQSSPNTNPRAQHLTWAIFACRSLSTVRTVLTLVSRLGPVLQVCRHWAKSAFPLMPRTMSLSKLEVQRRRLGKSAYCIHRQHAKDKGFRTVRVLRVQLATSLPSVIKRSLYCHALGHSRSPPSLPHRSYS